MLLPRHLDRAVPGAARKPDPPPADKTGGHLSVQLRHAAGRSQAAGGEALCAAAQHPARRPRQAEPGAIPQHPLQPRRRDLAQERLPFRLELLRAGFNQQTPPVTVSTVESGMAQDLGRDARDVRDGAPTAAAARQGVAAAVGVSPRRARSTRKRSGTSSWYFRARAIFAPWRRICCTACRRADSPSIRPKPSGEEFPAFTHFWIERPAPRADLDRDRCAARERLHHRRLPLHRAARRRTPSWTWSSPCSRAPTCASSGIAPLTSMFLFDETNRGRLDDYRPEVHDSDGLQITSSIGRAHIPPARESHQARRCRPSPRSRRRVSGWCSARAIRVISRISRICTSGGRAPGWSRRAIGVPGAVELVEIPSGRESNDNIVAFWRPAQGLAAGHPAQFAYRLTWLAEPALPEGPRRGRGDPLRRQPRRQAPRLHPGHRRRRREDRRPAARSSAPRPARSRTSR